MDYEVKDFSKDVIEASYIQPILVDFWAEWCGPCRSLGPTLERLAEKNNGEWLLVKVNSDEHPDLSQKYGIRSIPNVKLFYKGELINEFVGALPEQAVKEWLKRNIPNKYQDMLAHAEVLFAAGKESDSENILNEILSEDPQNNSARILLARITLFSNREKALELISSVERTSDNSEAIDSIKTIADLLDENKHSSLDETPTKILYLEAVNQLREKRIELSLEKFIEMIRKDRFYADDIARKACIAIFKFLGEENEITIAYRREFGRALYV